MDVFDLDSEARKLGGTKVVSDAEYLGLDNERFIHRVNAAAFYLPVMEKGGVRQLSAL